MPRSGASRVVPLLLVLAAVTAAAKGASYNAAAVMHPPVGVSYGNSVQGIISQNLAYYRQYAANASGAQADIILFPESGTGFLQVPHAYLHYFCEWIPPVGWKASNCTGDWTDVGGHMDPSVATIHVPPRRPTDPTTTTTAAPVPPPPVPPTAVGVHAHFASCLAQRYNFDVVINYCAYNVTNKLYYNIDVGMTKDGHVNAVYRKSHIVGTGPYLSQPATPDPVVFRSSFGVTFGMFTCYDFWFLEPMRYEIQMMGVRDFLFPNEMASGAPVLFGPPMSSGWSRHHDVNLVVSASFGTGTTGLFSRGDTVALVQPFPNDMMNGRGMTVGRLTSHASTRSAPVTPPRAADAEAVALVQSHLDSKQPHDLPSADGEPSPSTCIYGPPVNGLNFSFPCVKFTPSPGKTFRMSVAAHDAFVGGVCNATITTESSSAKNWVLGAIVITQPPNLSTPSGTSNVMCYLFHCDTPDSGCMGMDPAVGWDSDLSVSSVVVHATFGGSMTFDNTSPYPTFGFEEQGGVNRTGGLKLHTLQRRESAYMFSKADNRFTVASSAYLFPGLTNLRMLVFGVYGTSLRT